MIAMEEEESANQNKTHNDQDEEDNDEQLSKHHAKKGPWWKSPSLMFCNEALSFQTHINQIQILDFNMA